MCSTTRRRRSVWGSEVSDSPAAAARSVLESGLACLSAALQSLKRAINTSHRRSLPCRPITSSIGRNIVWSLPQAGNGWLWPLPLLRAEPAPSALAIPILEPTHVEPALKPIPPSFKRSRGAKNDLLPVAQTDQQVHAATPRPSRLGRRSCRKVLPPEIVRAEAGPGQPPEAGRIQLAFKISYRETR